MIGILRDFNFWDGQPVETGFVRRNYLDVLTGYLGNNLVKVVVGQRRCGKSYIMRMLIRHLMDAGINPHNILYINREMTELSAIASGTDLVAAVAEWRKSLKVTGAGYIFIDEVQEISGWESAVNSLSQDYRHKDEVFITGSNANLLAGELATRLSGRYVTVEVYPFGFGEYCGYRQLARGRDSFIEYLSDGGIPELFHLGSVEIRRNYIKSLKDSVILRDIIARHQIRDPYLLDRLVAFSIDSVGSLFSVNSIVNYLKSTGLKTNSETVGSYVGYLKDAYFLHESERYDIRGRRILSGERKYYLNDTAFKTYLSSSFDRVPGRYLENVVFLALKRRGYSVRTGIINGKEIDFIAEKGSERLYVQAAWLLPDESVIDREFGNLESISDNHQKIVVSADDFSFGNRNGIQHVLAWEFVE